MRIVFVPIGLLTGIAAGIAGKKAFERVWAAVDDREPPAPEHREVSLLRLAAALAVEGALFRLAKGMADHGARRVFAGLTGAWPGEERPEAEA